MLTVSACGGDEQPDRAADASKEQAQEAADNWHEEYAGSYTDELSAQDEKQAMKRATNFVSAASRHDDDADWWDRVEPFLTDTALPRFNAVDPRSIEYTDTDGDPEIHDAQTANLVNVDVPTDGPTMRVLLTRAGSDDWMVERWEYANEGEGE
ncbi:hypothetical protein [Nesterenkonia halophila]